MTADEARANAVALLAIEALSRRIPVELTARGRSMRPLLYDGDRLSVLPCGARELHRDDVAVVRFDGERILIHRVVSLSPLTLRGDALAEADGDTGEVLGRVRAFTRWGVTVRLDTRWGRAWSIVCGRAARVYLAAVTRFRRRSRGGWSRDTATP